MKFPIFNYHTHTMRCQHACGEDEAYIQSAIQAGLHTIGISDHSPFFGLSMPGKRMDYEEMDGYLASFRKWRQIYQKDIHIKIGFEAEYFDDYAEELYHLRKHCDYLILGQHIPCKKNVESFNHVCSAQDAIRYAELVCEGMQTGLFSYLAHPDYYFSGTDDISEEFIHAAHCICAQAAQCNIPLEINIKGVCEGKKQYRQGLCYPYPNRIFWEIASQYPISCVFGFDAHEPAFLQNKDAFQKACEVIEGLSLHILDKPFI